MPPRRSGGATSTPRKRKPVAKATMITVRHETALVRCARSLIKFVFATICSLGLSSFLFSWAIPITRGDLAWTSKHLNSWWHVAGLMAWRIVEIGIPWVLNYDARDVASLATHSLIPTYYLLSDFYNIRPTTILTVAAINIFCLYFPFLFQSDTVRAPTSAAVHDLRTTLYTTVLATMLYTLSLYTSYTSWLPVFLINHFDGLPDLRAAHRGSKMLLPTFLLNLPAGVAARDFLLVTPAGQLGSEQCGEEYEEHPGELLMTSIYRKYWVPLRTKTKTLVKRTAVLSGMIMANTVVQLLGTINGADLTGALGWSGVWTAATVAIAAFFAWIEAA